MSSQQQHLPVYVDLEAYRGDSWSQPFRFLNGTTPQDLTGAVITSKARAPDGTGTPLTTVVTNAAGGELAIYQPLEGLEADRYEYDIQVEKPAGVIVTWVRGFLSVDRDVTFA